MLLSVTFSIHNGVRTDLKKHTNKTVGRVHGMFFEIKAI